MPFVETWPEARVEALKALHARGVYASVIAKELSAIDGVALTKNAVIGKINRLKLPKPAKAVPTIQTKEQRRREQQNGYQRNRRRRYASQKPVVLKPSFTRPPRAEKKIVQELEPLNLTLADLSMMDGRPVECRFITNDDLSAALYCGHGVDGETSWCPHHRMILQPPKGWIGSKYLPKIACAA